MRCRFGPQENEQARDSQKFVHFAVKVDEIYTRQIRKVKKGENGPGRIRDGDRRK